MFQSHLSWKKLFGGIHNDCFSGGLSIAKGNVVFFLVLLPASIVEKKRNFSKCIFKLVKINLQLSPIKSIQR